MLALQVINITVRNRIAENPGHDRYICGNGDYIVRFDFDAEWTTYETKTARFAYGRKYEDVVFTGRECPVPVIANVCVFEVGVFAGNLVTTTPATVPADISILCSGGTPVDPAPDVYHQIMERIQEIEDNGVTDEQIQDAVAAYLEENPVDAGVNFTTDETLTLDPETGVLSVNTTDEAAEDDLRPMTAQGVYSEFAVINALLKTI